MLALELHPVTSPCLVVLLEGLLFRGVVGDIAHELLLGFLCDVECRVFLVQRGAERLHACLAARHDTAAGFDGLMACKHFRESLVHACGNVMMLLTAHLGEHASVATGNDPQLVNTRQDILAKWCEIAFFVCCFENLQYGLVSLVAWLEARSMTAIMADVERFIALWRICQYLLLRTRIGIIDAA